MTNERHRRRLYLVVFAAAVGAVGWMLVGREGLMRFSIDRRRLDRNVATRDELGRTRLHQAVLANERHLDLLVEAHRHDLDAADVSGRTALHYAAQGGLPEATRLLLARGANPMVRDKTGAVPLHTLLFSARLRQASSQGGPKIPPGGGRWHETLELLLDRSGETDIRFGLTEQTPLHLAIATQLMPACTLLLDRGADPNAVDKSGVTPLHLAVSTGELPLVQLILRKGANPNLATREGEMPVHLAARAGHLEIVEELVARGADPKAQNRSGESVIHSAVAGAKFDVALALFRKWGGATLVSKTRTSAGHLLVGLLPTTTADVAAMLAEGLAIEATDDQGHTLLHYAAAACQSETVDALLRRGAKVEVRDNKGLTPLYWSLLESNLHKTIPRDLDRLPRTIELLLQAGANPRYHVATERPIVTLAARLHTAEPLRMLLEHGVDVNMPFSYHNPLWTAINQASSLEATANGVRSAPAAALQYPGFAGQALPPKGAPDGQSQEAQATDPGIIELLLDHGADPNLPLLTTGLGSVGLTPMHWASSNLRSLQRLLNRGGNPKAKTVDGFTLMHQAARSGRSDVIQLLLDRGVDVDAEDDYGITPWMETQEELVRLPLDLTREKRLYDSRGPRKGEKYKEAGQLLLSRGAKERPIRPTAPKDWRSIDHTDLHGPAY